MDDKSITNSVATAMIHGELAKRLTDEEKKGKKTVDEQVEKEEGKLKEWKGPMLFHGMKDLNNVPGMGTMSFKSGVPSTDLEVRDLRYIINWLAGYDKDDALEFGS
ncbi:hypothetical protein Ptr902_06758 [Pyrenophora tritici-repentis]|nr:hypothetical protein Ptr902_06758 [Pyrenophora tritici-repentis]